MSGYLGKTNNQLGEVVGKQAEQEREDQWGRIPGKVVSFDPAKQTATIQPLYKPKHNGKPVDMPELLEVPIRFQRAGAGAITFPVKAGDRVDLAPNMRSSENYLLEDDGEASDTRSASLSDMEASVAGGEPLTDPIKNFDPANVHVRFDEDGNYGIRGNASGKIKIEGSEGNIYTILAEFMELVASDQLQINYGSSAGSGHALENRAQLMELAAKIRAMAL